MNYKYITIFHHAQGLAAELHETKEQAIEFCKQCYESGWCYEETLINTEQAVWISDNYYNYIKE